MTRIVKCTRCRHRHDMKDRIETEPDKYGIRSLVCPRCRCRSYRHDEEENHSSPGTRLSKYARQSS